MLTIRHNRSGYKDKSVATSPVEEFMDQLVVKKKPKFIEGSIGELLDTICAQYHTTPDEVLSKSRLKNISQARADFVATLHFKYGYAMPRISYLMSMDITSIRYMLGLRTKSKVTYADLKKRFK